MCTFFVKKLIAHIIDRDPSMVIPLLANQDLTPMLSQHDWQESFNGDSFISH